MNDEQIVNEEIDYQQKYGHVQRSKTDIQPGKLVQPAANKKVVVKGQTVMHEPRTQVLLPSSSSISLLPYQQLLPTKKAELESIRKSQKNLHWKLKQILFWPLEFTLLHTSYLI